MFRVLGEAVRRCRSRGGVLGGWQGASERGRCMWELWRALLASGRVDNRYACRAWERERATLELCTGCCTANASWFEASRFVSSPQQSSMRPTHSLPTSGEQSQNSSTVDLTTDA